MAAMRTTISGTFLASQAGCVRVERVFPTELEYNKVIIDMVMNAYVTKMGFDISVFRFSDVLSVEDWALNIVPKPVAAVLMLYPIKEASKKFDQEEGLRIEKDGQIVSNKLFYMKQTVRNACGTVGLLHAMANSLSKSIDQGAIVETNSFLDRFLQRASGCKPDEIATLIEEDKELESLHENAAIGGQSECPRLDDHIDTHFVCFCEVEGSLYELDGSKPFAVNHGKSSPETLLKDACRVIKGFMDRDPGELRYTIIALSSAECCVD